MDLHQVTQSLSHVQDGDFLEDHPNRALALDADGAIYAVAKPHVGLDQNFGQLLRHVDYLRRCAGAQWVFTFTTMALKGGREQMAYYQTYQKKRHESRTPEMAQRVQELRMKLAFYESETIKPRPCWYFEADEAIGAFHLHWIGHFQDGRSCVIATGDKDLDMYPGLIMHLGTQTFTDVGVFTPNAHGLPGAWTSTFGWLKYHKPPPTIVNGKKKPKQGKIVGRGTAFFWGQMLAGDGADTIAGLPKLAGHLLDRYKPLKRKVQNRPAGACGASTSVEVLSHCGNDTSAYKTVAEAYQGHFGKDWKFFFFENAFLLWMRKTDDVMDVMKFLEPLGFEYTLHSQQQQALATYAGECRRIWQEQNNA